MIKFSVVLFGGKKDFAEEIYEADKKTEFYPLGGECLSDQEYSQRRSETRSLLNIDDDKIFVITNR